MARRLRLSRYGLKNVNFLYLGAYRLKVVADDPENTGTDPHVFLFLRRPLDPATQTTLDDFHAIASPADMAEYPIGNPNPQTTYPFYRSNEIVLDIRNVALAQEVWLTIVKEVGILLRAMDALDHLVGLEDVFVGEPPTSSGSSVSI